MKAIYYGHSCIRLKSRDFDILFDPFITPNPLAKHININDLTPDYILLSHGHQDHVADMAAIQQNSGARVIAIVETAEWVARQGVDPNKVLEMNFGGTMATDFGHVKMVYALHTNSTPDGRYGGLPVGYLLNIGGKRLYFAGDTALTLEMKLLEPIDLDWAFLPIGGHYTMDVDDAIRAAKMIECNNIIGIHYNTFPPISIDKKEAIQKFEDAGLQLYLPEVGESVQLYNIW